MENEIEKKKKRKNKTYRLRAFHVVLKTRCLPKTPPH